MPRLRLLQSGDLLTVASLGDSKAMLDVGYDMIQLSVDHRVATHQGERQRLAAIDAIVAPVDLSSKCCSWLSSWKCSDMGKQG